MRKHLHLVWAILISSLLHTAGQSLLTSATYADTAYVSRWYFESNRSGMPFAWMPWMAAYVHQKVNGAMSRPIVLASEQEFEEIARHTQLRQTSSLQRLAGLKVLSKKLAGAQTVRRVLKTLWKRPKENYWPAISAHPQVMVNVFESVPDIETVGSWDRLAKYLPVSRADMRALDLLQRTDAHKKLMYAQKSDEYWQICARSLQCTQNDLPKLIHARVLDTMVRYAERTRVDEAGARLLSYIKNVSVDSWPLSNAALGTREHLDDAWWLAMAADKVHEESKIPVGSHEYARNHWLCENGHPVWLIHAHDFFIHQKNNLDIFQGDISELWGHIFARYYPKSGALLHGYDSHRIAYYEKRIAENKYAAGDESERNMFTYLSPLWSRQLYATRCQVPHIVFDTENKNLFTGQRPISVKFIDRCYLVGALQDRIRVVNALSFWGKVPSYMVSGALMYAHKDLELMYIIGSDRIQGLHSWHASLEPLLAQYKNLSQLAINHACLTDVPQVVSQLPALTCLKLANNALTEVPVELIELARKSGLKHICLNDNAIPEAKQKLLGKNPVYFFGEQ